MSFYLVNIWFPLHFQYLSLSQTCHFHRPLLYYLHKYGEIQCLPYAGFFRYSCPVSLTVIFCNNFAGVTGLVTWHDMTWHASQSSSCGGMTLRMIPHWPSVNLDDSNLKGFGSWLNILGCNVPGIQLTLDSTPHIQQR